MTDSAGDRLLEELRHELAGLPGSGGAPRRSLLHRLLAYLQTGSPALRALAAEGLGLVGDDSAVPLLIGTLKDPSPLVQWQAALALRALSRRGLLPSSGLAFDAGAAFQAWRQDLIDRVVADLAAPYAATRAEAANTLATFDAAGALPALAPLLADSDPAVRREAAAALVRIAGADAARFELARPGLLQLLRDADPMARAAATVVLGLLGNPAAGAWIEPLLHDGDADVRAAAATALGTLRDAPASAGLIAALVDDDPSVRIAAAGALGALGDRYTVPALVQLAGDDDLEVRCAALAALGQMRDPAALPVLIAALGEPAARPRYFAALALGRIGDAQALKPLAALRRDRRAVNGATVAAAADTARRAIRRGSRR